jgi:hypothetical protein
MNMGSFIKFPNDGECFNSMDSEHKFLEDREPDKPLYFDISPDFTRITKALINRKINTANLNSCYSCPRFTFVTVAWCISRPGIWFSIEPIIDISQFKSLKVNKYAKYLPYNEYYKYVIDAKRQLHYLACESWPEFGSEIYLQAIYSSKIHRCIVLAKGHYGACLDMLRACVDRTLKSGHNLIKHEEFMSELYKPFRVQYVCPK